MLQSCPNTGAGASSFSRNLVSPSGSNNNAGIFRTRYFSSTASKSGKQTKEEKQKSLLVKAGLPFVLFSVLASWVVSNALDGKLKEREASIGMESKSLRQAKMEEEHEEMMERLNKIVAQDFDNTKRIKRPHEVLEERRKEREKRNAWHRRMYRWIVGEGSSDKS